MSCEIKSIAKIVDLDKVQELFGFRGDVAWLNAVHFSFSPTGEIIVFGHGTKLIIQSLQWDYDIKQSVYTIAYTVDLHNPNDIIRSIICLPITGQNSSGSQSSVDWTCVSVGLSSGVVSFFMDFGDHLYSQQFHNEPVLNIKAQSGKRVNEEMYVFYPSCVCIIQGNHLIHTLQNLKQHLIKSPNNTKEHTTQDIIPYRKWGYGADAHTITDSVVVGTQRSCAFDHLLNTSLESGFSAKYRSAPTQSSLVLAAGTEPYIGFHYAKEGFVQPVLADVAKAVASKIKSALPNWLTGKQQSVVETPPPPIPSEPMSCRFGLCDLRRSAFTVWLAPGNQLAAVADNFGRVVLVDCLKGIAVRVFKGYRDAQCGFTEVFEKTTKKENGKERRRAMFLLIFSPRRSCIEVWPLQKGPKVAAFSASKDGQLLYASHSLMGITSGSRSKYIWHPCVFFDPDDQSFKEISIPFHCAITDSNSKTAKDLYLLKRIKKCLSGDDDDKNTDLIQEINDMCNDIQTDEFRMQCVEILSVTKTVTPEILRVAIETFLEQIHGNEENSELATIVSEEELRQRRVSESTFINTRKHLEILCSNYLRLIEFYLYINDPQQYRPPNDNNKDTNYDNETELLENNNESNNNNNINNTTSSKIIEKINITENELDNLQKLLDLTTLDRNNEQHTPKVTFDEKSIKLNNFVTYLSVFNAHNDGFIILKNEKHDNYPAVGEIIYQAFLERGQILENFFRMTEDSLINCEDLMKLLLFYWLNKKFIYSRSEELIMDMTRFSSILHEICKLGNGKVQYQYNAVCLWWQNIRELLLESPNALRGLLAAMMCRNVASQQVLNDNANNEDSLSAADDETLWEQVSQEACQWTLLIGKLDDISILGTILNTQLKCDTPILPIIKYEKPNISLKLIVNGGKGIISELVAKWIASTGIDVSKLLEDDTASQVEKYETSGEASKSKNNKKKTIYTNYQLKTTDLVNNSDMVIKDQGKIELDPVLCNLNILREHFPFSLQSSVLLSQLAWEYMSCWSKQLSNMNYLQAGLKCLETIKKADNAIKHGLCCMIWDAHLKIPLVATKNLINKTGRLPKEKLCLQDIGLSDSTIPEFLEQVEIFLDLFSNSIDNTKVELRYEEILHDGPEPLVLLALQQNLANAELIHLHKQLNSVLHLIAFFNIKYPKPIQNLFDAMSNQAFFSKINREFTEPLPKTNSIQKDIRKEFLCKIVTATIDLIRVDFERVYLNDHLCWIEKIEKLAEVWQIDLNKLKKHQIVELYAHGWDSYAEELLDALVEKEDIGVLLLNIAGRRLSLYPNVTPLNKQAAYGHQLADYLDKLHTKHDWPQVCQNPDDISFDKLISLSGKAFQSLSSRDSKELRIAGELFDACMTIKET